MILIFQTVAQFHYLSHVMQAQIKQLRVAIEKYLAIGFPVSDAFKSFVKLAAFKSIVSNIFFQIKVSENGPHNLHNRFCVPLDKFSLLIFLCFQI